MEGVELGDGCSDDILALPAQHRGQKSMPIIGTPAVHVPGSYRCLSRSAATPELEYDPKVPVIVHRFAAGEVVEMTEIAESSFGQQRGKTQMGWVSIANAAGEGLFCLASAETDETTAGCFASTHANAETVAARAQNEQRRSSVVSASSSGSDGFFDTVQWSDADIVDKTAAAVAAVGRSVSGPNTAGLNGMQRDESGKAVLETTA
eukprot:SAG31_NODE_4098_length_3588_cov_2.607624_6_plen_205_part_01